MKISVFIHSLGSNPIVRAVPFIDILIDNGHEVEILGFLLDGDEIYAPFRKSYDFKVIRTSSHSLDIIKDSMKLAKMATGEIGYAFKPLITSFLPGLIFCKLINKKKLYLDVEDNDVFGRRLSLFDGLRKNIWGFTGATGYWVNLLLHPFTYLCSGVTVSSNKLKRIYGGVILLNAPSKVSNKLCEIGSKQQIEFKKKYGVAQDKISLLFAGKPTAHKGLDILIELVSKEEFSKYFQLVLAGDPNHKEFQLLKHKGKDCCTLLGFVDYKYMSEVVASCDIAIVLQHKTEYSDAQIPAKILEAIAYNRPVLTTDVSDIRTILTDSETGDVGGWIAKQTTAAEIWVCLMKIVEFGLIGIKNNSRVAKRQYDLKCSEKVNFEKLNLIFQLGVI